ncbi:hypothetical protein GDO86_003675 [Hymenochirus boettgeri]|uniref:Endonuclease/exonuclease/phosphatase domain-containing protein n=1 Tax=Hymenochirus boettgeri TaxID=247094 RepID=A0A8T2K5Y8_9PIPI|nr:hypothetical protein GDO86_003675 [Hymenochirus boettgeri]
MINAQQSLAHLKLHSEKESHENPDFESPENDIRPLNDCNQKDIEESGSEIPKTLPESTLTNPIQQNDPTVLQLQEEEPLEEDGKPPIEESLEPLPAVYSERLWRDWEDLFDYNTTFEKHFNFSVLSYNILCQDLIEQTPALYQHCDPSILSWDYRWPYILQELQHWEADIICLQEVQQDHYIEQVLPSLSAMGYSCHYKCRTGRKTDGCCTCYKTLRFTLLAYSHIEFFRPCFDILNRDNVGQILLLKPLLPPEMPHKLRPSSLCVANTHLLYNPRRGDIKLAQLGLFLAEIERFSKNINGSHCPIILCGDLNATPDSPLYNFLCTGHLNYKDLPAGMVSGQERYRASNLRTLPPLLWPDCLGITDNCQYITLKKPKETDIRVYSRQQLLQLRYCDCCIQRPPDLPLIKGVTDNVPDVLAKPALPTEPKVFLEFHNAFCRSPFLLRHNLNLTSVYSHYLPRKHCAEVTVLPLGIGSTVDYIFYSPETLTNASKQCGMPVYQDGHLKLLGRLSLLSEYDLRASGGLPNPFCCSDHLSLLAQFSMELSAL